MATTIRSVTLYYQTAAVSGGNAGWAYNVIDDEALGKNARWSALPEGGGHGEGRL